MYKNVSGSISRLTFLSQRAAITANWKGAQYVFIVKCECLMRCKKVKNPIYCVYIVAYIVLTTMDFIDPFDGGGGGAS